MGHEPIEPVALRQISGWNAVVDVLVVGLGAAGCCAAIEAAQAGASVLVCERASGGGGAAALSAGDVYLGGSGGTPPQRAAGFEDSTEALANYLRLCGGDAADEDKIALYARSALEHYHWLCAQGVSYGLRYMPERTVEPDPDVCLIWSGSEEAWPFSAGATPCPRGHLPRRGDGVGGRALMAALLARVADLGVPVWQDSRASALIADAEGRVHGLVVRRDGGEQAIRARRGVILCAGGFAMNRAMVAEHAPGLLRVEAPLGTPGDDGSGIRMGLGMGADTLHMGEYLATLPFYPPASLIRGILVNELGERFINEDCYHGRTGHQVLRQPGGRAWLLVDNANFARPRFAPAMRIEIAAVAESWAELARELGLPAAALAATVEDYNGHAAAGCDPAFNKHPQWLTPLVQAPFAALDCSVSTCVYSGFTLGGLRTRADGAVLQADGRAIPGLYAAGRTTCGLPAWGGGYSSGLSLADSTFFGRRAGVAAAAARDLE